MLFLLNRTASYNGPPRSCSLHTAADTWRKRHAVLALLVQVRNRAPFQVIGDIQLADAHLAGLLQVLVSGTGSPMQYQRNRNLFPELCQQIKLELRARRCIRRELFR